MNFNKTNFFAFFSKIVDNFFSNITDRTHGNDNTVSIRSTVVIEKTIVCTKFFVDFVDVFFYNGRKSIISRVTGFTVLEENVTIFMGTAHCRMFRIQSMSTEFLYSIHIEHIFKISIIPSFDFLDFVRSTETVEEVDESNFTFQSSKVSYRSKIHYFLRIAFCKHSNTSLATGINIGMITKNVQ